MAEREEVQQEVEILCRVQESSTPIPFVGTGDDEAHALLNAMTKRDIFLVENGFTKVESF